MKVQLDSLSSTFGSLTLHLWLHQSLRLPFLFFCCKIWSWNLTGVYGPSIRDASQSAYWSQDCWVNDVLIFVNRVIPDPESDAFNDGQHASLLSRRLPRLKFLGREQFSFNGEDGLLYTRDGDFGAWSRGETGQYPLRGAVWRIDRGCIGGFDVMLRDHVDRALLGFFQIAERVLGVGEATRETHSEERGVVIDDLGVGEGGKIGRFACRQHCQRMQLTIVSRATNRPRTSYSESQLVSV